MLTLDRNRIVGLANTKYLQAFDSVSIRENAEHQDWKTVTSVCKHLSHWGAEKLRYGLHGIVKTVLCEHNYICKDHRDLFSNYYSKRFIPGSPLCDRLHFFSKEDVSADTLHLEPGKLQNYYLGYSVIRPVKNRCMGRTVIDPHKIEKNIASEIYCLTATFEPQIGGIKLPVKGFPYMSQDGEAMVCAHVALWGICRYLSQRYPNYGEIHPYDLVLLTPDRLGRRIPYRRMSYQDYSVILTNFGTHPLIMRVDEEQDFQDLYVYVESGFPVLVSTGHHVVTLIGHTIDYNTTLSPDCDGFIDSSKYLGQYIIMDDNYFPYALFGYDKTKNANVNKGITDIKSAVCPLPEKVFLPAKKARIKAIKSVKRALASLDSPPSPPFVVRMFLTTGTSFKRRKFRMASPDANGLGQWDKLCYFSTKLCLPHFVWVMEISTIDQYKQGYCLGEVVLDSTISRFEEGMIYLRILNNLYLGTHEETSLKTFASVPTKFKQYTHNLGETN